MLLLACLMIPSPYHSILRPPVRLHHLLNSLNVRQTFHRLRVELATTCANFPSPVLLD